MRKYIWIMLLLFVCGMACGNESSKSNKRSGSETGVNALPGDGNGGGNGSGGVGNGESAPTGFGSNQFVYLRTSRQLVVGTIQHEPGSEELRYGEEILYEHSGPIESFFMLKDRSGVIFTADRPRDNHTHAVYAISFEGGEARKVMEPFEGHGGGGVIFKVAESEGGLDHPVWFTMFTSTMSWNSLIPMWYRLTTNEFGSYRPGCTQAGPLAVNPWTGEVAMREALCGDDFRRNYVTIFSDASFSEEMIWMAEEDEGIGLLFAHTLRWLGPDAVLLGVPKGIVLLSRDAPREPLIIWESVSYFDISPDYEWILGVKSGELIALEIASGNGWILSEEVAKHQGPSW